MDLKKKSRTSFVNLVCVYDVDPNCMYTPSFTEQHGHSIHIHTCRLFYIITQSYLLNYERICSGLKLRVVFKLQCGLSYLVVYFGLFGLLIIGCLTSSCKQIMLIPIRTKTRSIIYETNKVGWITIGTTFDCPLKSIKS